MKCRTAGVLLLAVALQSLSPGESALAADEPPYERVWGHATLYDSKEGGFLRYLVLSGRLQIDSAWFDAEEGEFQDILWRRFRFGFKSGFLQAMVLHIEGDWNLNESIGDAYNRLTDAYIGFDHGGDWDLKILKQSAGFTLDGATSSKNLLTLQRNNLTNNLWFTSEYFTGIAASGTAARRWSWNAGIFSSDGSDELSRFEAGWFALLSVGGDFAANLGLDSAALRIDYVYNEEDEIADTSDFSQVLSLVTMWEEGRWGLWTDLSAGQGYGDQSDLWGLALMPFFDISPHFQLVLRFTFLKSTDDNGLRLGRYENEIAEGRGDEYREIYGGLNVFFYRHKFKWQTALQYTDMSDEAGDGGEYEGWGITTGLRLSW